MNLRHGRDAIEREVARHTGVSVRFERRGKHQSAVLALRGRTRFVVMSGTASDHRAALNQVADVRRAIRTLMGENSR